VCDEKKVSVLGDLRLTIYHKIAELSKRRSPKGWPLWVSPIQRVLLSASLASEPPSPSNETVGREADIFVVQGFITELELVLKDLSPARTTTKNPGKFTVAEYTAVSLHDARIFLAAFARLSPEMQTSSFEALLLPVERCLTRLLGGNVDDGSVSGDRVIASFLARIVTLCVNTYVMSRFGSNARDALYRVMTKNGSDLIPPLLSSTQWFFDDEAFVGVFDDWQDSELPTIGVPADIAAQKGGETTLQGVLELAFSFGFVTAKIDRCHLLYAAWNALGKGDLWNAIPSKVQQITQLPENLPTVLLQLRDDISVVHRLALRASGLFHPTSTLSKAIDLKDSGTKEQSQQTLKSEVGRQLRAMITKASRLVDKLVERYIPSDGTMDQHIPPEVFCIFEACAAYISFAVASYTKPRSDFFSSTMLFMTERAVRNRDRGYSTDSEMHSDGGGSEESNDALVETMERFQDVCDSVGAAPAHPDWLDKECRLWEGVTAGEAAEAALEAQACLTKLLSIGMARSLLSDQRALQKTSSPGQADLAVLASQLWWLRQFAPDGDIYGKGDRKYNADIGEICEIDPDVVEIAWSASYVGSRQVAKECWQAHSAQRVLGRYQDIFRNRLVGEVESAELRASGEWEVLLAGALTSACTHVLKDHDSGVNEDVIDAITRSERWFGVCGSVIDALVPTVALLRFGLCSGGRTAHPLSSAATEVFSFESNKASVVEELPTEIIASKSVGDMVNMTLATVARYPPNQTCDAVATHLMVDATSFEFLRGMEASAIALQALADVQDVLDARKVVCPAAPFVIERIGEILKKCGSVHDNQQRTPVCLLACLRQKGGLPRVSLNTLVSRDVDPTSVLSQAHSSEDPDPLTSGSWKWEGARDRFVQCLLSPFWRENVHASVRSLRSFAESVCSMLVMESSSSPMPSSTLLDLLSPIIDAFNQISDDKLTEIIRNYVCNNPGDEKDDDNRSVQESLSTIFAFLLVSRNGRSSFGRFGLVFSILEDSYAKWKTLQSRARVMEMTLLFACRSNKLFQFGTTLFEDLNAQQKSESDEFEAIENIKLFTDFLVEVKTVLSKKALQSSASSPPPSTASVPPLLPEKCSFAINDDFHDQHWYNCYTCGLTADKGCCSLCALVCHHGHDVVYARKSSFFCDCGGCESPENRIKCKCLEPQARDKFLKRIRSEGGDPTTKEKSDAVDSLVLSLPLCAKIVKNSFAPDGQRAINEFSEKGRKATWGRFMFECAKKKFEAWRAHHDSASDVFCAEKDHVDSYSALSNSLSARKQPPKIGTLAWGKYSSLGVSCSLTFQTKMSTDSASDRVKRTRLSEIGIVRSAMDADSRGRIVVAEPRGLVFCSGLAIVASLCSKASDGASLSRSSMRVISTIPVDISVAGLKFAGDNERVLVAWGVDEAKVIFMNESLTALESSVALDLCTNDEEFDTIVNAQWLPGSGTCAVLGRRRALLVYDFSKAEKISLPSLFISAESASSNLLDFAIVRCSKERVDQEEENRDVWKVFALMDNGSILVSSFERDQDGSWFADGELNPEDLLFTPIKRDDNALAEKGVSLTYLDQSNLLLYQSSSSAVVAFLLDEEGGTKCQFDLLPFDLSVSVPDGGDSFNVKGPYSHWRQLGMVHHGSTSAFRVSCSARSSTASEPVLLCLEFDGSETRVQECTRGSSGWFDTPQSCEGSAVFSAPILREDSGPSNFFERVFLCTLTLNGCLHIHAEGSASPSRTALEPTGAQASGIGSRSTGDSVFDILKFEKLADVTESKDLVYSADGLGR